MTCDVWSRIALEVPTAELLPRDIVGSMIPYDDLVAALSQWRARQGLPVSTMGGSAAPAPGSGPVAAQPGSGPMTAKPGSGPTRGAPPMAPPRTKAPSMPPPLAANTVDDALDVDGEMLEEQYENEGSDFAMGFNNGGDDGESTSIGHAPERP